MCDILKPPEQSSSARSESSSQAELVSAGPETTASVAAIMETHQFPETSQSGSFATDRLRSN